MSGRFWDRIVEGEEQELGSHTFDADAIKRFAAQFDPQPFHLDEAAATRSVLGGLCASGWHTAAVFMRLNVEYLGRRVAAFAAEGNPMPLIGPSPGFRDLRWPTPVYAGDTVTYRQRVSGKRVSESRAGWGVVSFDVSATNQRGEDVFGFKGSAFVGTN
ncbi:MaoC family dehydratase [Antarcticirhabdus aurantiaca]|uniref:MaoC family dehydratase n=1 Tax=Antarcticirhabdus aurantiaca TaxID=2606717 RepID=A0ACD4NT78_9HYPH|nr:MaoC family dehydratase [Antarcticirhabdus aurantiaca]WAJ30061.1 MaoC family dehydratase [Jeongeuplla avenae]